MVNGFVNMSKDKDDFVHLFFYPGVDDDDKPIYRNMDLSNIPFKYSYTINSDSSIDYKFDNKNICRLHCTLVPVGNGEIQFKTLDLKNE